MMRTRMQQRRDETTFKGGTGRRGLWGLLLVTLVVTVLSAGPGQAQGVLFVENGVGIGVENPFTDLTISDVRGTGQTDLTLTNPGAPATWIYAATPAGNFVVAKAGTGGNEFTVRERNHAIATMDVEGHVQGTSFKSTSSREVKTGFEQIDPLQILGRLVELPVTAWSYTMEGEGARHIGPVAEDFQRLFDLGDGRTISTVDASGVLMAALQGLVQKTDHALEEMARELAAKDAELEALKAAVAALEAAVAGK